MYLPVTARIKTNETKVIQKPTFITNERQELTLTKTLFDHEESLNQKTLSTTHLLPVFLRRK